MGKVAVFGLLKRQGKVFTVVVKNTKGETLMPVITRNIKPDSWVYTDTYRSYDALDVSELIILRYLLSEKTTLMGLKIFGTKPSERFKNITE